MPCRTHGSARARCYIRCAFAWPGRAVLERGDTVRAPGGALFIGKRRGDRPSKRSVTDSQVPASAPQRAVDGGANSGK